jgi:hypothetical protein
LNWLALAFPGIVVILFTNVRTNLASHVDGLILAFLGLLPLIIFYHHLFASVDLLSTFLGLGERERLRDETPVIVIERCQYEATHSLTAMQRIRCETGALSIDRLK